MHSVQAASYLLTSSIARTPSPCMARVSSTGGWSSSSIAMRNFSPSRFARLPRAQADRLFPGHWLIELYIAEAQGDDAAADRLTQRSAAIWRARAQAMPVAYTAHTFENELAFGNPQQALRLARETLAHRPYGDAHILVAEALLAMDRPAEARTHLLEAEAQGWRSAPLYARLSEAEEMLGNARASRDAADKARELNPRVFDPVTSRLWFGHG